MSSAKPDGPASRVHFFAQDGKHVSSLVYSGQTIAQTKRDGHCALLDPDRRARFKRARQVMPRT